MAKKQAKKGGKKNFAYLDAQEYEYLFSLSKEEAIKEATKDAIANEGMAGVGTSFLIVQAVGTVTLGKPEFKEGYKG